ncbi:A2 inhibitor and Ly6 PLAUR domain-containing protein-like [Podarcis lilfordi]|uniref:A2 inhibitor and Ly6 PLAUR domain-containing protein-like n=1 Tax=Podarcis lilfordi TaxID=74358 RepID=A0AA35KMT7_9SAUR|nr:A2 inhibitor and Ly6 PLAUR domain-containing protein-like [Podarcis lilfordi]
MMSFSRLPAALKCIQGYNATQAPTDCKNASDPCVTIKNENTLTGVTFTTTFYTCGGNDSCANAFTVTIGDNAYLRYTSACCTTDGCNANLKWGAALKCIQGYDATQAPTDCKNGSDACVTIKDEYTLTDSKSFVMKGCGTSNVGELYSLIGFINGTYYQMRTAVWKSAKSSSTKHILGKSSFLLLLPSISSILFMKFLS